MMWEKYGDGAGTQMGKEFHYLQSKFSRLLNGRSEGDRQIIHGLFDSFNALDFRAPFITNSAAAILLINQCCTIVPPTDTFLVAKGCQLISNLVLKQNVKVEGKTLAITMEWIVQALKYSADIAVLDILLTLEAILRGNGRNVEIENCAKDLLGPHATLVSFLTPTKSNELKLALPWEVHLAALKCLEAATFSEPEQKQNDAKCSYLQPCLEIFLRQFEQERAEGQEEVNYCKVLTTSMKGLQNVIQQSPELSSELIGDLLGVIKAFMLYGLPGHTGLKPQRVFAANVGAGQTEVRSNSERAACKGSKSARVKKAKTSRVRRKVESSTITLTEEVEPGVRGAGRFRAMGACPALPSGPTPFPISESDFSDSEAGHAANARSQQARVRHAAINLLHSVVKITERRVMFGYWSSLFPSGPPTSTAGVRTLATCLLRDPSPRVRAAVISVLTVMLLGSRLFLNQAEASSAASSAFTPFSVSLGYMVTELHRTLCLALAAENTTAVAVSALKCVAALVQNTPYHRLESGLITKVVRSVRAFLRHKDSTVQVAALTVLGSVASVEPPTDEITEQLSKPAAVTQPMGGQTELPGLKTEPIGTQSDQAESTELETCQALMADLELAEDDDYDEEVIGCTTSGEPSWLLGYCLDSLVNPSHLTSLATAPVPVKVESLQVMAVLSQYFFAPIVAPHLPAVVHALSLSMDRTDEPVVRRHAGHAVEGVGLSIQQSLATPPAEPMPISLQAAAQFWQTMLAGPVLRVLQCEDDSTLRAVGCDCLASIGLDVFQELTRDKQVLIVTVLFGCCRDEEHNVRQSAVRGLAMCIQFQSLREDLSFMMDTAEAVMRLVKDESPAVRVKASWSLGNLSDALVRNSKSGVEDVPPRLLLSLLDASIVASQDNDKVRSNSVRSVGNLLLLLTHELYEMPQFHDPVEKAVGVLVKNATSGNNMKCRWNACYAIGNALRNPVLHAVSPANMATVYHALTRLVINFRNFKVRINAAAALATPATRQMYGREFVSVWEGLMAGLDNAQEMADFSEFKHQDNLVNQLCVTLTHVMSLAEADDLSPLLDGLSRHAESLAERLTRFRRSVVPEREGEAADAARRAVALSKEQRLTDEQREAARILVAAFARDPEGMD